MVSFADPLVAESWSNFPQSRAKLLALVAVTQTPGVFFLSGDVHFAEINRAWPAPTGYPLYDVTSSGLTHSWGSPILSFVVKAALMGSSRIAPSAIYTGKNFGEIDVLWGTVEAETRVTWRIIGQDGLTHIEHTILLADLSLRGARSSRMLQVS